MGKENARLLATGDCRVICTYVNQRLLGERPRINVKVGRGLTLRSRAISRKFELQARSTAEKVVVEVPKQFHISWSILKDILVTSSYGPLPQRFLWTLSGIQELSVEEQISLASL